MSTADVTSAGTEAGGIRAWRPARRAALGASFALAAVFGLSACSSSYAVYTDGWWDNGDAFTAPAISELFDENGEPTCAFPLNYQGLEQRSTPAALVGAFLFEVVNREADPSTGSTDAEKLALERSLGSLDRMYQYLHPHFAETHAIGGPDDLAPLKAEFYRHLPGLGEKAPISDFTYLDREFVIADEGEFEINRIADVEGYLEDHNIPIQFRGLEYTYQSAKKGDVEYLLRRQKSTGDVVLYLGDQMSTLTNAEYYQVYSVTLTAGFQSAPYLRLWVASDGCPDIDESNASRWYIYDYAEYDGQGDDGLGTEPEPEVSPSPSAEE